MLILSKKKAPIPHVTKLFKKSDETAEFIVMALSNICQ